ncbi:GNAT family N-acetyltransferase [Planotetraspora kaengkrachanensis]|uniref:Acetyltransferase n=1 Tax=Planotetraspora kaengkrachanensis TaxID=575193 RepID=A0A8J3LYW3_9ACTN|nr:GNAT family N-acetyltransferase [Planotetraspora kaengkrachanensis]GIG78973.1 acetyltransferase [Planotetraspora kaengkrachanensis]
MTAYPLPPESFTVRRLTAEDAEEYRAFRLEALRHAPTAFTSTFGEESAKPLSATIDRLAAAGRPHDAVVGAYDRGRNLVGVAGLAVSARRQERHKATLFGMAVAPHATGQGIGKMLVRRILDLAAAVDDLLQVGLTVSEGNLPAERLYRSCGFQVWGREPRAVINDGTAIAKLHMVRMLDEPVLPSAIRPGAFAVAQGVCPTSRS